MFMLFTQYNIAAYEKISTFEKCYSFVISFGVASHLEYAHVHITPWIRFQIFD